MSGSKQPFIAHVRESDGVEQSLADHLVAVSLLAGRHAAKLGLSEAGALIGLLHDLGKYSAKFQNYICSATGLIDFDADAFVDVSTEKGKIDHSTAGAQYLWRALKDRGRATLCLGQLLALCIASHHSGLIDCLISSADRFGSNGFARRMSKDDDSTHFNEALSNADSELLEQVKTILESASLVSSLQNTIRNIISNTTFDHPARHVQISLVARYLFSCLIDADRQDTADFETPNIVRFRSKSGVLDWGQLVSRLETYLATLTPTSYINTLRREIAQHCLQASTCPTGMYNLTVPTGGGKTLASLRFALHHARERELDRIFFVIPFTSIIDQNASVIRKILEPPGEQDRVVLEVHSNLGPERQSWREKILSDTWDAPVVLTTMVQFLECLFNGGTRDARRMHQLAKSVIVFDEIQTLPVKCVHLFNNAVNFLTGQCGSTVVLCTATQPRLHAVDEKLGRVRLSGDHDLVPDSEKYFAQLQRVEVCDQRRPAGWSFADVAALAVAETTRLCSCLVIVNTRGSARRVYELASDLPDDARVHLSTYMCPAHRKAQLARIIQRLDSRAPILCVSTQLIEAGVDVDFRCVIRALAGLDNIAQAAGRCNRNAALDPGIVHVVNLSEENLSRLPEIRDAATHAQRVLDDFRADPTRFSDGLFSPKALSDFYRYHFFEKKDEMAYRVKQDRIGHDDTLINLLSSNTHALAEYRRRTNTDPALCFRQGFATAGKEFRVIDSPTQGVIVPFEEGEQIIAKLCADFAPEKQIGLLRRAQQFTVNVFEYEIARLRDAGAIHPIQGDVEILYLEKQFYSPKFGLSLEQVSEMESQFG